MTSINPNYSINYLNSINFKAKSQNNQLASNPLSLQPNVSFKGTEALAAYNYSLVHKDDVFDLPKIKPLKIPTNINEIQGERIYNSKGELVRIIDENEKEKNEYHISDNKIQFYKKLEKKTGIEWFQEESNGKIFVLKTLPNNESYDTFYKNGEVIAQTKNIFYPNGDDLIVHYSAETGEYNISKHYTKNGKNYSSFATYDKNKKCIDAFESQGTKKMTSLKLKDGIPYEVKNNESKCIPNKLGKDDIDLTGLEPDVPLEIDIDNISKIDGEKKYFSNNQIEQIITPDGYIYDFDLDGLNSIKKDNKTYLINRNEDGEYLAQTIITDLGNGLEKRSNKIFDHHNIYISKNGKDVKGASYHNNGELSHYYNEEQKIIREFDENGNLIAAESDKNI